MKKTIVGIILGVLLMAAPGWGWTPPGGWDQFRSAVLSGKYSGKFTGLTLTGPILFTDNLYDIGASGATRPRTGYFGTSVKTPALYVTGLTGGYIPYIAPTTFLGTNSPIFTDGTNVGIGTATPTAKLDVGGSFNNTGTVSGSIPTMTNPKATSQAVNLTAAASGSSGITVADNANIDFGTGNFTLVWRGSVPDWTPVASVELLRRYESASVRTHLWINDTTGYVVARLGTTSFTSSVAPGFADGTFHEVVAAVSVGATNTTVTFFGDGMQIGAPQVSANVGSLTSTSPLYILGSSSTREVGTSSFAATYNRALTAAEVLDLYRNGVNYADKWGSQTSLITGNDSTFSGASNWANGNFNAYDETGDLSLTASAAGQYCSLGSSYVPMVAGKRYRLTFDLANVVGSFTLLNSGATTTIASAFSTEGTVSYEFTAVDNTGGFYLYAGSDISSADFDNFTLTEIGATLALEPEGIGVDKWYDSTGNGLNASYPTAGATLTRPVVKPAKQGTITAGGTGAVTVTIAMMLSGVITANPDAARAYTFEAGATSDAIGRLNINDSFEWSIINTNVTNAVTVTASSGHTIIGNAVVALSTSGRFKTVKTAANTLVTYRMN